MDDAMDLSDLASTLPIAPQATIDDSATPSDIAPTTHVPTTASLEQFQTDEQRHVLDTVAQIRKCGLDGVLSLPQLVVCGDQSAGKSSVLEALTEIPFPRSDNLCTRFATEVTLRRAPVDRLIIHVIPDPGRPATEQTTIKAFRETITDLAELPRVVEKAKMVMGLVDTTSASSPSKAFARDVLSVEIEGPLSPTAYLGRCPSREPSVSPLSQPHTTTRTNRLYLKSTRSIPRATEPWESSQNRTGWNTIQVVRRLFLSLARNEDVFFKLGWHVVKNRKFEESAFSFDQRHESEWTFFQTSNFKALPLDCVGIDALRTRLSLLLFEHIKRELPNLRRDLDQAITDTASQLDTLGDSRTTAHECRSYLTQLSMDCLDVSKAAINGHYEGEYFQHPSDDKFSLDSPASIKRFRAVIQYLNYEFADAVRKKGPKYLVSKVYLVNPKLKGFPNVEAPITLSREEALEWIQRVMERSRGKEPYGNYNPLIMGELFWEQTGKWQALADRHIDRVAQVCKGFFDILLAEKCPKDIHARLSALQVMDTLRSRRDRACQEVKTLMDDNKDFPTTYNRNYTDTIQEQQANRTKAALKGAVKNATSQTRNEGCQSNHMSTNIDQNAVVAQVQSEVDGDMLHYSCEHVLDCLLAMYEDKMTTFVQNVTTQAAERHLVRGLDKIFSPVQVAKMDDKEVLKVAAELAPTRRHRQFLVDRLEKLKKVR